MLQTLERRKKYTGVILSDEHTRIVQLAEPGNKQFGDIKFASDNSAYFSQAQTSNPQ